MTRSVPIVLRVRAVDSPTASYRVWRGTWPGTARWQVGYNCRSGCCPRGCWPEGWVSQERGRLRQVLRACGEKLKVPSGGRKPPCGEAWILLLIPELRRWRKLKRLRTLLSSITVAFLMAEMKAYRRHHVFSDKFSVEENGQLSQLSPKLIVKTRH